MNQSYEKSFREESVRLALSGDKSISQTARDLGVKESTLYNWISIARRKTDLSVYTQAELDRIAKELNGRPRKTLSFLSPAEKLEEVLL